MSLRILDNASLIHFTAFTRSLFHWGQNVGRQNCAYLELLSSLNVVLYICETLSVKKMKRCQNGNLVLHVKECGLSKATLFKSPLLEPIRIQGLRQLRVINLVRHKRFACTYLVWLSVWQSAPTVSFQLPFLWIAGWETCKIGSSSRSSLRRARLLKLLLLQGRWNKYIY